MGSPMIELMQHLRRRDLFGLVSKAVQGDAVASAGLCEAGSFIASAVEAGWFALPAGRNGAYSRPQHFWMGRLFEAAPWVASARAFAETQSGVLRDRIGDIAFQALWSHPQGLSSFNHQAKALAGKTARMPLEWASGAITVDLLVQCLEDNYRCAEALTLQITHLMDHRTLEPGTELGERFDAMISGGMRYDIPRMLTSTLRLYLENEVRRKIFEGIDGAGFVALLESRKRAAQQVSESAWRNVFREIQWLAGILEDHANTEHLGTINRRLKQHAGPAYRLTRQSRPLTDKESLTLSLSGHYVAGRYVDIETVWAFKNWVLALADILEDSEPNFEAYISAEKEALERLDLVGDKPLPTPEVRRRPLDDFDEEELMRGQSVIAPLPMAPEIHGAPMSV